MNSLIKLPQRNDDTYEVIEEETTGKIEGTNTTWKRLSLSQVSRQRNEHLTRFCLSPPPPGRSDCFALAYLHALRLSFFLTLSQIANNFKGQIPHLFLGGSRLPCLLQFRKGYYLVRICLPFWACSISTSLALCPHPSSPPPPSLQSPHSTPPSLPPPPREFRTTPPPGLSYLNSEQQTLLLPPSYHRLCDPSSARTPFS
ncbi:hypothetical protein BP00DRAFT_246607 [Aspergillus indologenus CBS 114.80]|uniref:Uncharacterized protein n=1 Tax=Aspergillus indologenus CBS 114.80 TaxID=1450541 RepID=A0A2V5HXG9_9EURO|nr:hypothetical protein BP00DRAFT_246607 [Aspergillus indologenus CBS 114.80]